MLLFVFFLGSFLFGATVHVAQHAAAPRGRYLHTVRPLGVSLYAPDNVVAIVVW